MLWTFSFYLFSVQCFGAILFLQSTVHVGACTWPADFLSSTWVDSIKGDLVFQTSTMTGWSFTVGILRLTDWDCHTTDFLDSHGYLVMRTNTTFIQFHTQEFYGYRCLHLTKITEASYRYYEIAPIQTANLEYERMIVHDLAIPNPPTEVTELCPTELGAATGSEYKLLVKKGFEDQAKIRCPYSVLGIYDYTHTASSGTVTCNGEDSLDMCADNKEMKFDYTTCATKVAYSASDTVWCVDTVPAGETNFLTVYNAFDDVIDDATTFRFSCFGISADGTTASVTPQNCKKDQTPDNVPVNNAGNPEGAILTLSTASSPCPVLSNPSKGQVSIATDGAVTMATYTCANNFTLSGDGTRVCQENDTWSGTTPSCTCETPISPTNGAVTLSDDGTTATYTCIANFTLDGDVTRTCQTDTNTWAGSDPTCIQCNQLEVLQNGNVTVSLTDTDTVSVAVYTCEAGATLNGVTSRKCLNDGTWTETKPICTSCPDLTTALSGTVNLTTNGTTSSASVSCAVGYTVIGETQLNCLTNGSWDVDEPQCVCNPPTTPANGSIHVSLLNGNKTAVYSCDSGFTLNGSWQRTCQSDGSGWSGTDPECVVCKSLSPTEGLSVSILTNSTVSTASFTCDIKYTLRGYSIINCLPPSGNWEYDSSTCERCTDLTTPESGNLIFSTNGTSTTANYSCTTGTSLKGYAMVECNSDGIWSFDASLCVECEQLEGLQDGSYVVSSNGTTSEVIYSCADGYTLIGSSQANCQENGTWTITSKPYCSPDTPDSNAASVVTGSDTSLLPAVIALAVLAGLLILVASVAIYCYCKAKNANESKGYSMHDDEIPKSIPIAAVPPSAAPMDHQKPLFDGGRATALTMAPESHRQNSRRDLFSASTRSLATSASISRLNLEMIRETTSSSVYGSGVPAPWSGSKDSIASGSTDLPRMNSPTMSSLYSEYSSPRRGYSQTPRYTDDSEDTGRASQLTDENMYRETPSPRKSPKKRKKALRRLSHADIDENEIVPNYMRETKASTNKTYQDMMQNDNKQSARVSLSVTGNERTGSYRSAPKLTSPRV